MRNIAILGTGGFAREVFFLINQTNSANKTWNVCSFLVRKPESFQQLFDIPIMEEDKVGTFNDIYIVTGMGSPEIKRKAISNILNIKPNVMFAKLIHPNVEAATDAIYRDQALKMGEGSIITAGNILTVNIAVGNHVHINLDCTVGHDVTIGDYATISPGVHISGNVHIGNGAFIGTGASVIEGKKIGNWAVVGAGACVVTDIPDYTLAIGVPAKIVKDLPRTE